MQVVIDIDKKVYDFIKATGGISMLDTQAIANAIFDAEVLPCNYERLIDADYLDAKLLHNFNISAVPYKDRKGYRLRQKEVDEAIINVPTVLKSKKQGR